MDTHAIFLLILICSTLTHAGRWGASKPKLPKNPFKAVGLAESGLRGVRQFPRQHGEASAKFRVLKYEGGEIRFTHQLGSAPKNIVFHPLPSSMPKLPAGHHTVQTQGLARYPGSPAMEMFRVIEYPTGQIIFTQRPNALPTSITFVPKIKPLTELPVEGSRLPTVVFQP